MIPPGSILSGKHIIMMGRLHGTKQPKDPFGRGIAHPLLRFSRELLNAISDSVILLYYGKIFGQIIQ
jgi:hypothetical protein